LVAIIAISTMLVCCKKKIEDKSATTATSSDELTKLHGCRDQLLVQVAYSGASPLEVEGAILLELEEAVAGVKGVREVHGFAREGAAQIVIELASPGAPGPDAEVVDRRRVADEVRAALDEIGTLPEGAERPVLVEQRTSDRFIALPIFGALDPIELRTWAHRLRDGLLSQAEILSVEVVGAPRREVRVNADPTKLKMYGLSGREVARAVQSFARGVPSRALIVGSEMPKLEELGKIVVAEREAVPVHLSDIATIEVGFERMPIARIAGERALLLVVRPSPDFADADFSALVAKHISSAPHPGGRLFASDPIHVSYCAVGAPEVSGAAAVLGVSAGASTIAKLAGALGEGDRPALLLEGASMLAFDHSRAGIAQVIGFPRGGASASELLDRWQSQIRQTPGVSTEALAPQSRTLLVQLGHEELEVLGQAAQQVQAALGTGPAKSVSLFPGGAKPELNMVYDGDATRRYSVTPADIARRIRSAKYGDVLAHFQDGLDAGTVVLRVGGELGPTDIESPAEILALQITTSSGATVPLGQLVSITLDEGPSDIYRRKGRRQVEVRVVVASPKDKGVVKANLESKLAQLREDNPGLSVTLGE
jgi:multidrug efflux pump subunit AcrB